MNKYMSKRTNKQRGFTLVELAVVMVIIGILLGSILKGQQLIDNARGKRVFSDLKAFEALVWTYYDRKGVFPGDCDGDGGVYDGTSLVLTATGSPAVADTLENASASPVALSCLTTTPVESIDSAISDLRAEHLLGFAKSNLEASKHAMGGQMNLGTITNAALVSRNVIVFYDVPQWMAEMIDANIDGEVNGLTGRVRSLASLEGLAWPAKVASEGNVALFYAFDKEF